MARGGWKGSRLARTVVQADFGVHGSTGVWMINIYTLFYAALIPVVGKVADRRGRKGVFTACMGMAMGAPANYMILENTAPEDSSSAIATIALVRQVGTSLAPAVYIGLIGAAPDARGYAAMLLGVAAFNAFALVCMLLYRSPRR